MERNVQLPLAYIWCCYITNIHCSLHSYLKIISMESNKKKIEFIGKFAAFHLVFVFGEGKPISTLRLHSKFSNGCNRSHNWISDWNSPVMYNIKPKNGKKKTATRKVFSEVGWKRNNNNNTIILTIFGTNVA